MSENIPMLDLLNSKLFGVSSERLLQLKFSGGYINYEPNRKRKGSDLLDNIGSAKLLDGDTLDSSVDHWPSTQIGISVIDRPEYRFIDYFRDSVAKWYGPEITKRKAIITMLNVSTPSLGKEEEYKFSNPHMSSSHLYLQFLFFCLSNITKIVENNKNYIYTNPFFKENTKYIITGTFKEKMPYTPIDWKISKVSKIKDKMDVIVQSLKDFEEAVFIIPDKNEADIKKALEESPNKYLQISYRTVNTFKDLIKIFNFESVGSNKDSYSNWGDVTNRILATYKKDFIIKDLFSDAKGEYRNRDVHFEITVDNNETSLIDKVFELRDMKNLWVQLIGEGGMGKTTSLVHLFEEFSGYEYNLTPFYLELQQINYKTRNIQREFWILDQITKEYSLDQYLDNDGYNKLEYFFKKETEYPEYLLLLDGHNEVMSDHLNSLNKEIESLVSHFPNMIIIITSRTELSNFNNEPVIINLSGISEKKALNFLESNNYILTENIKNSSIIRNPMYLKMLVDTNNVKHLYNFSKLSAKESFSFGFYETDPLILKSKGEILKTYFAFMKLKWFRNLKGKDEVKYATIMYIFNEILPTLALNMEKESLYEIDSDKLTNFIKKTLEKWDNEDWMHEMGYLPLYELEDKLKRKTRIIDYILNDVIIGTLGLLYKKENVFSFTHQDIRDYFAATYYESQIIKFISEVNPEDEVKFKLKKISLHLNELKDDVQSYNLQCFLGQLSREVWNRPVKVDGYYKDTKKITLFDKLLNCLRYVLDNEEIGYLNYNIIQSMIKCGTDLSGYNFSFLCLEGINLNGIRLGRPFQNGANLTGVNLQMENIFPMGHKSDINAIAISPDERYLATGSEDNTIKIWDAKTNNIIKTISFNSSVKSLNFSPDSRRIISGHYSKVYIYNIITIDLVICLEDHKGFVESVTYSNDEKKFLTASWDGTINVYDASSFELLDTLSDHEGIIKSAVFSPNNKKIISASGDSTVKVWDAETYNIIETLVDHENLVSSITISPDSKIIVSGSYDGTIKIWDGEEYYLKETLNEHEHAVETVSFSSCGKMFLSGSVDRTIRIWNLESYKLLESFDMKSSILFANFYKNDNYIISNSENINIAITNIYDTNDKQFICNSLNRVSTITFYPDNQKIILGSYDNLIRIWDMNKNKVISVLDKHKGCINSVQISNSGQIIISSSNDSTIKIWNANDFSLIKTLTDHKYSANSITFSKDDQFFLSSSKSNFSLWRTGSWELLYSDKVHKNYIKSVVFTSNNDHFILGYSDGGLSLWNTSKPFSMIEQFSPPTNITHLKSTNYTLNSNDKVLLCTASPFHSVLDNGNWYDVEYIAIQRDTSTYEIIDIKKSEIYFKNNSVGIPFYYPRLGIFNHLVLPLGSKITSYSWDNTNKNFVISLNNGVNAIYNSTTDKVINTFSIIPGLNIVNSTLNKSEIDIHLYEVLVENGLMTT